MDTTRWAGRRVLGLAGVAAFPALLLVPRDALGRVHASAPALHFWTVSSAAMLCLVLSLLVVVVGCRRHQAEIALLGSGLSALSALSVVHGVTAPGYLYGPNAATITAGALALPAAGLAALPLVVASTAPGGVLLRRWKAWTLGSLALTVMVCVALLTRPATAVPDATWFRALVASVAGLLVVHFAARQVVLFEVGRRRASLVAAAGAVSLGVAGVLGTLAAAYSPGWWAARVIDNAAVLAIGAALLVGYRQGLSVREVLDPVVTRDPLVALELGLSPEVHAFVAALDRKDPSTRAHVVRTGELAMRVGERARLPARELRSLGLGGLLHDVGKLVVPADILTKPDRLTEEEFATMRTHAERGALLLERSRTLREVAPLVRSHHERYDGNGYPQGLAGPEISPSVAIISAVDAWDAMVSTRHYRDGMSRADAMAVLRDGAGSQWSPSAVSCVLAEVENSREPEVSPAFDDIGRVSTAGVDHVGSVVRPCLDALPHEVARIWDDDEDTPRLSEAVTEDGYRDLFESAPFAYFSVGADGRVAAANARACELLGMSLELLVGRPVFELYADTPEGRGRAMHLFDRFLAGRALREEELEMRRADGSALWISLTATPIVDGQGRVVASRSVALDVTARRAAEQLLRQSEEHFRRTFDEAPIGMAVTCRRGRLLRVNHTLGAMTGYSADELLGTDASTLVHPEDLPRAASLIEGLLGGASGTQTVELRLVGRDGVELHTLMSTSRFEELDGTPCFLSHVQDITERRHMEDELRRLALRDPLTGLYNRRGLVIAGQPALDALPGGRGRAQLLFVDVDELKAINDRYGHHEGDRALVDTATLLRSTLRESDVLARLGGDEFGALVLGDPDDGCDDAPAPVERIAEALARWNATKARPYELSISVGVSRPGPALSSIEAMLADADRVMYQSKERRRRQGRVSRSVV
ncbi:MAG: PAS domain S-box protein [Acidimicrobiia bacterium]